MKHSFQTRDIALNLLVLRPQNVRAEYGSGYSTEQMAPLAANIAECGLLQLLLVAPLPDQDGQDCWGVLAGGHRLAALAPLAQDKSVKAFGPKMAITCRVVPEAHATKVKFSFSENALHLPMDALERYEAFAAMQTRGDSTQNDWDAATDHPFCKELADGTLPLDKMRWYLVQDYKFIDEFVS